MFTCLNCGTELVRQWSSECDFWGCPDCGSRAASLKMLRRMMGAEEMNRFLCAVEQKEPTSGRMCPGCNREMRYIEIASDPHAVTLDVCLSCRMVWFDPNEHDQMNVIAAVVLLDVDREELRRREKADRQRARHQQKTRPMPPAISPEKPGMTEFDPWSFCRAYWVGWVFPSRRILRNSCVGRF